jgi:polysaccharide biosynthesis transport protein
LTSRQAKTYQARTLVRIQQSAVSSGSDAVNALDVSQRLAQTYAQILDSGALTNRIRAAVGVAKPSHRVSKLSVSAQPVQDTELMWISARGHDTRDAAAAADAAPRVLRSFMRETGRRTDQVVTVKTATVPTSAAEPQLKLNVALALLLGLIFNGALALVIELIRDRLPEPEELSASLGYPVLATIPVLYRGSSPRSQASTRRAPEPTGSPREQS